MKRRNIFIYSIISIILLGLFIGYNANKYNKWLKNTNELQKNNIAECKKIIEFAPGQEDFCKEIIKEGELDLGLYYTFTEIYVHPISKFSIFIPLLILSISLIYPSRYLKEKIIYNEINRTSYNKSLSKMFKKAFIPIIIIPIVSIIGMIFSFNLSGNFNTVSQGIWNVSTQSNPITFIVYYLINTLIFSSIYVLIGLIVVRKNNRYPVALIQSFLLIMIIQIILEVFINSIIFTKILSSGFGIIFNILNFTYFLDYYGPLVTLSFSLIVLIILSFVTYLMYKDKESLLIELNK